MEEHRGLDRCGPLFAIALAALMSGCVDNPPLPFDAYDRPLRLSAIDPAPGAEPIALDQTFEVQFNTWLDPTPLTFFNTAQISSGGVRGSLRTRYEMVDRTLVIESRRPLEPGLIYNLSLNPDVLFSVTGQPYDGPVSIEFVSGNDNQRPLAPPQPAPVWDDVEPIFDACNDCHGEPEWKLPPMTREGILDQPSEQRPDLFIVRAFDAPASYLMHKILWSYPIRDGTAQPPPWAGYDELSIEDQRLIEAWIRGGAQP